MSVQFGQWNFDDTPIDLTELRSVERILSCYAPDGMNLHAARNAALLYGAMHTTPEAIGESQPFALPSGAVVTWDGRLDNRLALIAELSPSVTLESTDVQIVAATYERDGVNFLSRLIGEWALSVWNPVDRSLLLARDPFGSRHLYYLVTQTDVIWSTILDVFFSLQRNFTLDEEYLAGWFASFPAADRTPYSEIRSVPPSCRVVIRGTAVSIREYWTFGNEREIRYRRDEEYEEHFRFVFREAVRRRLRSNGRVAAELSGGMDSAAIVCMADTLSANAQAEPVSTVSYYDDREPNWDERPYFTAVEKQRHQPGFHIDIGSETTYAFEFEEEAFAPTPASIMRSSEASRRCESYLRDSGSRILLSGIGGDETMGGVPTLVPELADLLARGHFVRFFQKAWLSAVKDRIPIINVLSKICRLFLPSWRHSWFRESDAIPWLNSRFVQKHRAAFRRYEKRLKLFGPLPSVQENRRAFAALQRQLTSSPLVAHLPLEKRYPFLDRDLVAFVCAIPREQLVRPGQRRSLMRRALRGIVPELVLERKRKAFVSQGPLLGLYRHGDRLSSLIPSMITATLDLVDPEPLWRAVETAQYGKEVPILPIVRTLMVEFWLRSLRGHGMTNSGTAKRGKIGDLTVQGRGPRSCQAISAS
jgi:asparagine synthase (glutamine-hydrolysing)